MTEPLNLIRFLSVYVCVSVNFILFGLYSVDGGGVGGNATIAAKTTSVSYKNTSQNLCKITHKFPILIDGDGDIDSNPQRYQAVRGKGGGGGVEKICGLSIQRKLEFFCLPTFMNTVRRE